MEDLLQMRAREVAIAVLDLEMTGLSTDKDRVCEIAVVRADGSHVVVEFQTLVRPPIAMTDGAREVSGITEDMLSTAPVFAEVADDVQDVLRGAVFVAHNAPHDLAFLQAELARSGRAPMQSHLVDTLEMSRRLFAFPRNNLAAVCERLGIDLQGHHRALADARATFSAYHMMLDILDPQSKLTVGDLRVLLDALNPKSALRKHQKRLITEAFKSKTTLLLDYINVDDPKRGTTRREVAIYKVRMPRIQGFCYLRQGERVFRIDRIHHVEPGTRTYEVPAFKSRI